MTLIALFVLFNALLALGVLALSLRAWRTEPSSRVRPLWLLLGFAMGALVLGGLHRFALQAARIGWLDEVEQDLLLTEWQIVQSAAVAVLVVWAYFTVRRSAASMYGVERVAGSLVSRIRDVHVDLGQLTRRERDVMEALTLGLMTDRQLAAHMMIAESTVKTHLKSLFRKTGLSRREDLMALAILLSPDARPGPSPKKGKDFPPDGEKNPPRVG